MVSFKKIMLSSAGALLAVSAPAMADVKTSEVQYQDLDLTSAAGQNRLATRIRSAVKSVCGNARVASLAEKQDVLRCQRAAMESAMPKAERTIARYAETKRVAANEPSAMIGN